MPKPIQEPQASSKAKNQDLKDMDVLRTFNIKIESQNSEHGCTKDQWPYPNTNPDAKTKSGTPSLLQNQKQYLNDVDDLCTYKTKVKSQNLEQRFIKEKWPHPNQYPDAKPKSGTFSILYGRSMHLQNQERANITWSQVLCQTPN